MVFDADNGDNTVVAACDHCPVGAGHKVSYGGSMTLPTIEEQTVVAPPLD